MTSVRVTVDKSTNVRFRGDLRRERRASAPLEAVKLSLRLTNALSERLAAHWVERLFFTPLRYPRPAREVELLTSAQRFTMRAAGYDLAGYRFGDSERRILLVHGWEGRGTQLGLVVPELLQRGFSVVTFDAPAHGDSPGKQTNLLEFAEAVQAAATRAGPFEGVMAHSLGSVAATLALRAGLSIDRAVYVAPWCSAPHAVAAFGRALDLREPLLERVRSNIAERLHFAWDELALTAIAPAMKSKLLVLHDAQDRDVPASEGEALAKAWPGARIVVTEGLGHRRILRDPEVGHAAVAHLSGA